MSLHDTIQQIPFEDHHVHAPEKTGHVLDAPALRRPFTEAAIPAVWERRLASHVSYRWMLRQLAELLDVEPDEEAVLAARNEIPEEEYNRLLADDANLGACYADHLFSAETSYLPDEWAELIERPVHRILRIETFVEQQAADCPTLDDALEELRREILSAPDNGMVGLKSIAGYRVGLEIEAPSASQRRLADIQYTEFRRRNAEGQPARIETRQLVDTIVWTAFEEAAKLALPVQFHVALGDDDIVLTKNDPSLMRALFQHEPFRSVPVVLLHCYPYHRHAGYLASLYPNVHVDLGLTIPLVGPGSARVLEEAMELTPVDQLLASSDGHMIPEFQWFGVRLWRWALDRVITGYMTDGILGSDDAERAAAAILRDNAQRIYPV